MLRPTLVCLWWEPSDIQWSSCYSGEVKIKRANFNKSKFYAFRAQQSIKLFLMQVFGKNIFIGDKVKNVFIKSDKVEEEGNQGPNLLATLKNTANDLGNGGQAIRTHHDKHSYFPLQLSHSVQPPWRPARSCPSSPSGPFSLFSSCSLPRWEKPSPLQPLPVASTTTATVGVISTKTMSASINPVQSPF